MQLTGSEFGDWFSRCEHIASYHAVCMIRIDYMNLSCRWGMLFAYPADFDPVSTTELDYLVSKKEKFKDRNVKCIALSCYPVRSHHIWIEDIRAYSHMSRSDRFPYPIISDPDRDICGHLGILNLMDSEDGRQLADRAVSLFCPVYIEVHVILRIYIMHLC